MEVIFKMKTILCDICGNKVRNSKNEGLTTIATNIEWYDEEFKSVIVNFDVKISEEEHIDLCYDCSAFILNKIKNGFDELHYKVKDFKNKHK